MKNKEQLAEQYAEEQNSAYTNDYNGFLAGYEAGQPKWISVEEQTPDDERTVLVWINNTENPQWNNYRLGSYLNEKWYCVGGRKSHEIVTHWSSIPAPKKSKNR